MPSVPSVPNRASAAVVVKSFVFEARMRVVCSRQRKTGSAPASLTSATYALAKPPASRIWLVSRFTISPLSWAVAAAGTSMSRAAASTAIRRIKGAEHASDGTGAVILVPHG